MITLTTRYYTFSFKDTRSLQLFQDDLTGHIKCEETTFVRSGVVIGRTYSDYDGEGYFDHKNTFHNMDIVEAFDTLVAKITHS